MKNNKMKSKKMNKSLQNSEPMPQDPLWHNAELKN